MNTVQLVGRTTKKPELRQTKSGKSTCKFTLAVNRRFKQEGQPEADFINCVAWGKQAEALNQYVDKGDQLAVAGRIQTGSYTANDGHKVYTTDVMVEAFDFIGSRKQPSQQPAQTTYQQPNYNQYGAPAQNPYQQYGGVTGYNPQPANEIKITAGFPESETLDIETSDLPF